MKKFILITSIFFLIFNLSYSSSSRGNENNIYKKIDLFSEVLDKVKKFFRDGLEVFWPKPKKTAKKKTAKKITKKKKKKTSKKK